MKKYFFMNFPVLIISLNFPVFLHAAQQDSIKFKIVEFLIQANELERKSNLQVQDYVDLIYIVEVLKFENIKVNGKGVYKFGTFSDHSDTYLLLKNATEYEIIDLKALGNAIIKVINFLKAIQTPCEDITKYVEATIDIYQKNQNSIPWK